jgi:membrane protein
LIALNLKKDIKSLINRFVDDDITALAAQLSYNLIISFFPFLIFLMTLVGYSSLTSQDVLREMQQAFPEAVFQLINNVVIEIVDTKSPNLLSFSIIITIWSASSGFRAIIKGLNKAYDEEEERSIVSVTLISVVSTLTLGLLIIATILFLVFGEIIGNMFVIKFGYPKLFKFTWNIVRYMIIISMESFVFMSFYHYLPSRRLTWKEVIPGSVFTTVGWIITSLGFAFYVNNFANYSRLYGSLGAVFVLLTWLYLTSMVILIGGEINAVLAIDKKDEYKKKEKDI